MSQITRCPSCATLFKVVADQLRISDGWVRCGHCQQVFDASEHLQPVPAPALMPDVPLDRQPPPPQPAAPSVEPPRVWGSARGPGPDVPAFAAAPAAAAVPPGGNAPAAWATPFAWTMPPAPASALPLPAAGAGDMRPEDSAECAPEPLPPAGYELPTAPLEEPDIPSLRGDAEPVLEPEPEVGGLGDGLPEAETRLDSVREPAALHDAPQALHAPEDEPLAAGDEVPGAAEPMPTEGASASAEPSFVRMARRKAFWRRPAVRVTLGLAGVALLCALVLQVVVQQRDAIAAARPQWRPFLQGLCAPLRCRVEAHRQIASVVVDSSSFNKLRGESYQFSLALKNRSHLVLAMPAVELTLTDAQDQPVLRRVLLPQDLGAPPVLPALGDWSASLQVHVALGNARIAGYRVLAFYP
ncbi:hypothetical protein B2J86_13250 [Acidovorax sp. SRB_14]|nr:hypothetical protein [Acidovorax sp. SRB_14]